MAQTLPPVRRVTFSGVYTGGSVLLRPGDTAVRCHNIRPLPGGAVRLRGGWKRRILSPPGSPTGVHNQFHEFRKGTFAGGVYNMAQINNGTQEVWYKLDMSAWSYSLIEFVGPSASTLNRPLAISTVRDKVFYDNGQGVHGPGTPPQPPLSSWDGTKVRYVGLHAYPFLGTPPDTVIPAAAGFNNVQKGMTIWVGLYNSATNHFSNAIECWIPGRKDGRIGPVVNVPINITNLDRIQHGAHTGEAAEQFYVFYATLDGLFTPFLILDATGSDIYKVPVGTLSTSLSLTNTDPKGFIVSQKHEMPRENFPPRPMKQMCYQNGRVYYTLRPGGSGAGDPPDFNAFSYITEDKDAPAVLWSAAADDYGEAEFVGIPEESFPLVNKKYVPSGEVPLKIADLSNRGQVLVLTATRSYWLEEISEGLHIYQRISENRGILDERTFTKTPRGPMWVTQNNEIVLLHEDSMSLEVVSENYSELLHFSNYPGATLGVACDYLLDPINHVDRYQVWASDGFFICHDFWLERDQQARGVTIAPAWSGKAYPVTSAESMRDASGKLSHIVAKTALWTQEGQPENRNIQMGDSDPATGSVLDIEGDYISQWLDFTDPLIRKEIIDMIVTGDAAYSKALNDRPLTILWYADLYNQTEGVTDNILSLTKHDQSETDLTFIGKLEDLTHMRWLKYRCKFKGHLNDRIEESLSLEYPAGFSATGELSVADQFVNSLNAIAITVNPGGANR